MSFGHVSLLDVFWPGASVGCLFGLRSLLGVFGLVPLCNILTYISSINTWASGDSPLAQLVKELDLCLYLCVIRRL